MEMSVAEKVRVPVPQAEAYTLTANEGVSCRPEKCSMGTQFWALNEFCVRRLLALLPALIRQLCA